MKQSFLLLIALMLVGMGTAFADEADAILGLWSVKGGDARVEITKASDGTYEGRIVWMKDPNYPDGDPEAGKPRHDRENPDKTLQSRPIQDLKILSGFTFKGDNLWKGGTIYDPENGNTYKCKMTLKSPDALDVRGFIGVSVLGRTENWTRYKA